MSTFEQIAKGFGDLIREEHTDAEVADIFAWGFADGLLLALQHPEYALAVIQQHDQDKSVEERVHLRALIAKLPELFPLEYALDSREES